MAHHMDFCGFFLLYLFLVSACLCFVGACICEKKYYVSNRVLYKMKSGWKIYLIILNFIYFLGVVCNRYSDSTGDTRMGEKVFSIIYSCILRKFLVVCGIKAWKSSTNGYLYYFSVTNKYAIFLYSAIWNFESFRINFQCVIYLYGFNPFRKFN